MTEVQSAHRVEAEAMKRTLLTITVLVVVGGGVWVRSSTTPWVSAVITSVTDGDTVRLETEDGRKLNVRLARMMRPKAILKATVVPLLNAWRN